METHRTTWNGRPVSAEPPFGSTIIVRRSRDARFEYLLLHRVFTGDEPQGQWEWTPPSGARYPGETIDACARRELEEETGIDQSPQATAYGSNDWPVFLLEADSDTAITLSPEHDRYKWVDLTEAIALCSPKEVASPFERLRRETE
ncbi:MAG: NUDIX domain-containing protein [Anaerolineales bacterium]